jgi:hypothetical protein
VFVKPTNPGAVIRDPHSRLPLPAEGAEVPETSHWIRRLNAGEVVRCSPPAPLATREVHAAEPAAELELPAPAPTAPLNTRTAPRR